MTTISPESWLAKTNLAVASINYQEVLTLYESVPSTECLDRLNRECLSPDQSIWLSELLAKWHLWKGKNNS